MTHINQRRDTSANWVSENPVLQLGEVGWETDTRKSKLGDGTTAWNDLDYTAAGISATKADVGLDQVDNTSDLDKPVSSATSAALALKADTTYVDGADDALADAIALKADIASPTFTGDPKAPTPSTSDSDTSIATTAFVKAAIAEKAPDVQVFTASGTWNKPTGAKFVVVEVVGGGGAGGGAATTAASQCAAGGGGGGGGYAKETLLASALGSTESVTVGAGGTGASGAAGGNGGSSSFGSYVSAAGGTGGAAGSAHTPPGTNGGGGGSGAAGSGGDLNISGGDGAVGFSLAAVRASGGQGGSSRLGNGAPMNVQGVGTNGFAGQTFGGGGGGALNIQSQGTARAGGNGGAGVVIVTTYFA